MAEISSPIVDTGSVESIGDAPLTSIDASSPSNTDAWATKVVGAGQVSANATVPDWGLHMKNTEDKGRGVYAGMDIPAGQLVIMFEGPIYDKETCPEFSEALQVSWLVSLI